MITGAAAMTCDSEGLCVEQAKSFHPYKFPWPFYFHCRLLTMDVYPQMIGRRPLKTPSFIKSLFADDAVVVTRPDNLRFAAPSVDEFHQD